MPIAPWARRSGPRRTICAPPCTTLVQASHSHKLEVQRAGSEVGCPADWDPKQVTAAIVTCGGLCPGLNDVIQNIVFTLEDYGVRSDAVRWQCLL